MPRLYNLLSQSMLFTGTEPVARKSRTRAFRSPDPFPVRAVDLPKGLTETNVRENPIWQFSWDPAHPGTFTKVTIRSRGMDMDYGMPAKVYDRVEFRNVKVVRKKGVEVDLYLAPEYMIDAWYAREGEIRGVEGPLWPLPAQLDASMLVAFGYKLENGQLMALTKAECDTLDRDLMPALGIARPRRNLRPVREPLLDEHSIQFFAGAGAIANMSEARRSSCCPRAARWRGWPRR
jgi:hypothetical protein